MIGGAYRLLVTGSREWDDLIVFRQEMDRVERAAMAAGATRLMVVHGNCRPAPMRPSNVRPHKSADWLAHLWVALLPHPLPVGEEPHPADWTGPCRPTCRPDHRRPGRSGSKCPAAGNYRNQNMVDRGADQALAFWRGRSPGTRDCIDRLRVAGIPTHLIHQPAPARTA